METYTYSLILGFTGLLIASNLLSYCRGVLKGNKRGHAIGWSNGFECGKREWDNQKEQSRQEGRNESRRQMIAALIEFMEEGLQILRSNPGEALKIEDGRGQGERVIEEGDINQEEIVYVIDDQD